MAQLVGTAAGSYFGPAGAMAGSLAGAYVDRLNFGGGTQKQQGPQLTDLLIQNASYGQPTRTPSRESGLRQGTDVDAKRKRSRPAVPGAS